MLINKKKLIGFCLLVYFFIMKEILLKSLLGGEVYNMIHLFVFMYKTVPCLKYVN